MDWTSLVGLAWPAVILVVVFIFFRNIRDLCSAFISRFERDEVIKIGSWEFKGARIQRRKEEAKHEGVDVFEDKEIELRPATAADFEHRKLLRYESKFVRLVHRVFLTGREDYPYRVLVYLKVERVLPELDQDKGFQPARINDVDYVEYYLGKYFGSGNWGSWFIIRNANQAFAIEYLTYDEVTCIARIHFHKGEPVEVRRYLDTEMGEIIRGLENKLKEQAEELYRAPVIREPA
jgi:hypothetical protein